MLDPKGWFDDDEIVPIDRWYDEDSAGGTTRTQPVARPGERYALLLTASRTGTVLPESVMVSALLASRTDAVPTGETVPPPVSLSTIIPTVPMTKSDIRAVLTPSRNATVVPPSTVDAVGTGLIATYQ